MLLNLNHRNFCFFLWEELKVQRNKLVDFVLIFQLEDRQLNAHRILAEVGGQQQAQPLNRTRKPFHWHP